MNAVQLKPLLEVTKELHVLYVEDNDALRMGMIELLQTFFASIDSASDGQEGLDKCCNPNNRYDLIISDIDMPRLRGTDMLKKIRQYGNDIPLLFISAHNEAMFLFDAIEFDADGFIIKPIIREQLMNVLFKICRRINERKLLESYVTQIETQNLDLSETIRKLTQKDRMLDTMSYQSVKYSEPDIQYDNSSDESNRKIEQIKTLVNDDLYELRELLVDIDYRFIDMFDNTNPPSLQMVGNVAQLFQRYGSVLGYYSFFNELSTLTLHLSTILKELLPLECRAEEYFPFKLIETFCYVLGKWHDNIASGDPQTINQYDASLISDLMTIISLLEGKEPLSSQSEDDIFDF